MGLVTDPVLANINSRPNWEGTPLSFAWVEDKGTTPLRTGRECQSNSFLSEDGRSNLIPAPASCDTCLPVHYKSVGPSQSPPHPRRRSPSSRQQTQDVRSQLGFLDVRLHWLPLLRHSLPLASGSMEYRYMSLHVLDIISVPKLGY